MPSPIPKDEVIADNLVIVEMDDRSIEFNIADYDLSLRMQRSREGQLAYNFVSAANELFLLGLSDRETFELQNVSGNKD